MKWSGYGAPIADSCTSLCTKARVAPMKLDESEVVARLAANASDAWGREVHAAIADDPCPVSWEWVWLRSGIGFLWAQEKMP